MFYALKVAITALLIVAISETAKRSTVLGALLASIPLVSVLGMIWLYLDTHDAEQIAVLSTSIFWLVIPSLLLFIMLPVLLRQGVSFSLAMPLSMACTAVAYGLLLWLLGLCGIRL